MLNNNSNNATPISEQFLNQGVIIPIRNITEPIIVEEEKILPPEVVIDYKAKFEETQKMFDDLKSAQAFTPPTEEELIELQKLEEKNIFNFVVQEKKLSALDYEKFINSKSISNKDYVFEKYKLERKDENISSEELILDFEEEYKLDSNNEKVLNRANKKIDREANEYRSSDFKEFHNVKDEYKSLNTIKAKAIVYKGIISEALPEVKITYTPDGLKEPIELVVDYADLLPEIQKELASPEYFQAFTDEKVDTKKAVVDFIIKTVKENKSEVIATELAKKHFEALKNTLEKGSIHPIPAQTGSTVVNKTITHPLITKLMGEEGIISTPNKTL